mgnify:CR=1 FL=1
MSSDALPENEVPQGQQSENQNDSGCQVVDNQSGADESSNGMTSSEQDNSTSQNKEQTEIEQGGGIGTKSFDENDSSHDAESPLDSNDDMSSCSGSKHSDGSDELKKEIEQLKTDDLAKDEEITNLKSQLSDLRSKLSEYENKIKEFEGLKSEYSSTLEYIDSIFDKIEDSLVNKAPLEGPLVIDKYTRKIKDLEERQNNLIKKLEELKKEKEEKTHEMSELKRECNEWKKKTEVIEQAKSTLEQKTKELEQAKSTLEQTVDGLKKQLDSKEYELSGYHQTIIGVSSAKDLGNGLLELIQLGHQAEKAATDTVEELKNAGKDYDLAAKYVSNYLHSLTSIDYTSFCSLSSNLSKAGFVYKDDPIAILNQNESFVAAILENVYQRYLSNYPTMT